ncbi:MAG TPA: M28 family peptidase [Pseudonocardiaceae bacterium]|nr:M28 family peptidase [Pseudonocardiaceae bacterium]
MRHLQALQRIADDNGGNRATPGPGYDASVDYVAAVLRSAGFQVSTPEYRVDRDNGSIISRNVIAQTRTGSTDQVVMLGAHLDSVEAGPGINDNGSGVAALLEIATKLGGSPGLPNAVRLGFWGSEEDDMQGSTDYVESLSGADRARVALYMNLDMLASPNAGYFVQGGRGDGRTESGPPGSAVVGDVLGDELTDVGVTAQHVAFDDGSDFVPFIDAGIPTGGVLTGDEQRKTVRQASRWGGRSGQVFDACYHAACDRVDNIDSTALDRYTDAIAAAVVRFATSPQPVAR